MLFVRQIPFFVNIDCSRCVSADQTVGVRISHLRISTVHRFDPKQHAIYGTHYTRLRNKHDADKRKLDAHLQKLQHKHIDLFWGRATQHVSHLLINMKRAPTLLSAQRLKNCPTIITRRRSRKKR